MIANRFTVRLYRRSSEQAEVDTNLDPGDDAMLRAVLERMVTDVQGDLRLDLSEWSIVVHSLGGGRIRARCRITSSGATSVDR